MPRHLLLLATIASATIIFAATQTKAGPLADAAARAEQQANSGDVAGAHETLRKAVGDFSQTLPFAIGKAVFVEAAPAGFAMYDPKPDPVFKGGETLVTYVEPVGLTWKEASDKGKLETRFTVDFDILNPKGEVLASQKAFGDFTFKGYQRNQEIYATLRIDVAGAPSGDYVLRYRFNDINSGRSASVDQPFKISGP
ncbi:hypothetical protein GOC91_28115 [Sinorhizobium medicae]|uniref:Uncharacterized protein n=2 Tax=Sinorhizobium medicae TaxID=110321 RepID=A0A508WXN3_9HYPH|nr:hypothetical protein [Sinorhizobium medicae]ABR60221.1 conserved hypothetical protein [Sinorhizobium medicae WSM419]MBO1940235.1 hypothetical protein [Sinorhizobium medicae]MBO1962294.1 hypothetical protein [Sinorhizobium medicae]MDX0408733.1 hypothetical protein [Sinorhizobium medicae]MDX0413945.1 hypothetical protein [Sinorhizobium medicae]